MKIQWLLPSIIPGLLMVCLTSPAQAGTLSSWRFDQSQNRLEFNTDEGVQPRAQLVLNPTRLVIDLPGTTFGQPQLTQTIGGAVQQVRVGQFDGQTTRIVIELTPGYTIDPQQIRFRGLSPTQWTVQLPQPQYDAASAQPSPPSPLPSTPTTSPSSAPPPRSAPPALSTTPSPQFSSAIIQNPPPENAITQVQGVRVTADGLFIQTQGATPEIETKRSRDRRSITIQLANAILSPRLGDRDPSIDRFGVDRLEFRQEGDRPPTVKVTLRLDRDTPDWQASSSSMGGIVLLPGERAARAASTSPSTQATARPDARPDAQSDPGSTNRAMFVSSGAVAAADRSAAATDPSAAPATIQGIELNGGNSQLLIHADRAVAYTSQWQNGAYQVTLSPARLAAQVTGPQLGNGSPLLRVRLRQESSNTVVLLIQPASGVRFGSLNVVSPQLLALEVQRSQPVAPSSSPNSTNPATSPSRTPNSPLPQIPNGRVVVVVDPGHGGSDPGAVGIDDIQEKEIVLAIAQQVGAYLEKQGVQVILTRTNDSDVELEPRVQMAEQANATLFVSIHANSLSMDRPDVNGVETYYYTSGEQFAQVMQSSVIQGTGMDDRGIHQARFYVLRRTTMPAILVEVGYVTGSEDEPRLASDSFRTQMAQSIARGVLQYIQQNSLTRSR